MATSSKDARATREAKLDELHERLTRAIEQLVSGEDWARALAFPAPRDTRLPHSCSSRIGRHPPHDDHVRDRLTTERNPGRFDVFDQLEGSSEDEHKLLTAQRDKLEAERLKLVQAHYADAIPLDLLKSEQERIRTGLDQITRRLDTMTATYTGARDGLDKLLDLLTDLGDLYNKCEPAERRVLNRALFTRITIDAPAEVTAETKLPRHQ